MARTFDITPTENLTLLSSDVERIPVPEHLSDIVVDLVEWRSFRRENIPLLVRHTAQGLAKAFDPLNGHGDDLNMRSPRRSRRNASHDNEVMDRKPAKVNALSAKHKLADFLARRDHSPRELKQKLSRSYPPEEVNEAIAWAESKGWLPSDEESFQRFSSRVGEMYHRRKKGIRYINSKLHSLGLPEIPSDHGRELEKAVELVENKFFRTTRQNVDRLKIQRFLMARGFEAAVIREVQKKFAAQTSLKQRFNQEADGDEHE